MGTGGSSPAGAVEEAAPTPTATADHAAAAWDALLHALTGGAHPEPSPSFEDLRCPVFVTWNAVAPGAPPRLRGCIGTLEPRPLRRAVPEYALAAGLRDRRFAPLSLAELPGLSATVSVLHSHEAGASWDDWEVGTHGITIEFADPHAAGAPRRCATFLPGVAAAEGWGAAEAVDRLARKAGCGAGATPAVRAALALTRYRAAAATMAYGEYRDRFVAAAAARGGGPGSPRAAAAAAAKARGKRAQLVGVPA